MPMALNVDPEIAAYYEVTFIFGALVNCQECNCDLQYTTKHPACTDESYYDAALAMHAAGWVLVPNSLDAYCRSCAIECGLASP